MTEKDTCICLKRHWKERFMDKSFLLAPGYR
jgi:hypothetical protein